MCMLLHLDFSIYTLVGREKSDDVVWAGCERGDTQYPACGENIKDVALPRKGPGI